MKKSLQLTLLLFAYTLSFIPSNLLAQCEPGETGNAVDARGSHFISWRSQLIVDKSNIYINETSEPVTLQVGDFNFHAVRAGNPVTPFIVSVAENDAYTVLEIGTTRTNAEYAIGSNTYPFGEGEIPVTVAAGERVAVGMMEAFPDGTGIVSRGTVTLNIGGDPVWFTGGPQASHSASISKNQLITPGRITLPSRNWDNNFNIEMCAVAAPFHDASLIPGTCFAVNTLLDGEDTNLGDGICQDENGNCSLRAALQEANLNTNESLIQFTVAGELSVQTPLPVVLTSYPLVIDGLSAPGYESGSPAIAIRTMGFDALSVVGGSNIEIRGLDLSSGSSLDYNFYGLHILNASNVNVHHNTIHNRVRAIHVEQVTDLFVENNDLRDSGSECAHPAMHIESVTGSILPAGMRIQGNLFGGLNTNPHALIKLYNCHDLIISDGSVPNTDIVLENHNGYQFPVLIYASDNIEVHNLDLSYSGGSMTGVGVLSWESSNVNIMNNVIHNRIMAINIDGGASIQIEGNDVRDSGLNPDEGSITFERFNVKATSSLTVKNNNYGSHNFAVSTYLSFHDSEGITVGDADHNITFNGILGAYYPIKITGSRNMTLNGLNFIYEENTPQTSKAIWLDSTSHDVEISENYFHGWGAAVHLEEGSNINYRCNTAVKNNNAILVDGISSFAGLQQNNFACNAIAVHQRGSVPVDATDNYWGHALGSSSLNGYGDHIIGSVDVTSHSTDQHNCATFISSLICAGEICDNGIDDDLDGLIDCLDGGCLTNSNCLTTDRSLNMNVDFVADNEVFKVYPNPNSGIFILEVYQPCWEYRIYDMTGKSVLRGNMVELSAAVIDMSRFKNGMYMIELVTNEEVLMKSFIKH